MDNKKLRGGYISSLCMELYLVLQAGMSVSQGLSILLEEEDDKYNKGVLTALYEKTELGMPLSDAVKETDSFPSQVVYMTQLGEKTGNLDVCLKSLSEYYSRMEEIKASVKNAVVYPSILFVMMMFVVIILVTRVMPVFKDVLAQIGAVMSPLASAILSIGIWLNANAILMTAILALIVLAVIYLAASQRGRAIVSRTFLKKKTGGKMAIFRFASSMAMAMKSGIDSDEALDISINFLEGTPFYEKVQKCKGDIENGTAMSTAFLENGIFSSRYCRMLEIGVRTGSEDVVMEEIARRCGDDVNESIENLIRCVEPAIVIIMCAVVGLILISVMLPLMGIMSSLG